MPSGIGEPALPPVAIATTTTASATSESATSTRASRAVREMPRRLAPVRTATAARATSRCDHSEPGHAYDANVSAIAAHDAVFPITNPQPARNPHHSPSRSRP